MTGMVLAHTRAELADARERLAGRVAVVMTMGALHDGHARLIRAAREIADAVIVTIFVNPLQFGPNEDFERYPRTPDADLATCAAAGVELVFAPPVEEVYPDDEPVERLSAGHLGSVYEGAVRPGHFDGVVTVVSRLLDLTRPDVALFGEKDAQQLVLIRRMAANRHPEVEIVGLPTVRHADGLARSSRNRYLTDSDREVALAISTALRSAADHAGDGVPAMLAAAHDVLGRTARLSVDYLDVVDSVSWEPPGRDSAELTVIIAARVGSTRLIDNVRAILVGNTNASAPDNSGLKE
jgi:pantoate--beta-alanine ligase